MNSSAYRSRCAFIIAVMVCALSAANRVCAEGPVAEETGDMSAAPRGPGLPLGEAWDLPPLGARGRTIEIYSNGEPLEDLGHPASQQSRALDGAIDPWIFLIAVADDFSIPSFGNPGVEVRISIVRVPFYFFGPASATATPTDTWTDAIVTVYANNPVTASPLDDVPNGEPGEISGYVGGPPVGFSIVPQASLMNQLGPTGVCRSIYTVDIPVDIVVAKNTTYWLSVVPRYIAPPQTAWLLSDNPNAGLPAVRGFRSGNPPIAYWTSISGNQNSPCNPTSPLPMTHRSVSFKLFGDELSATEGACCDQSTGVCEVVDQSACTGPFQSFAPGAGCATVNCTAVTGACCDDTMPMLCAPNVNISACTGPTSRFLPDPATCPDFDPPCGTTTPGACCIPNLLCADGLTPAQCAQSGGVWNLGDCDVTVFCPPVNDNCDFPIKVHDGSTPFNTTAATTSPDLPDPPCDAMGLDIWYAYEATCTGTVTISLCAQSNFDSMLVVYAGWNCPALDLIIDCDDDSCGAPSVSPTVSFDVEVGDERLIRIGSPVGATGSGEINISCIATGSGACCHADGSCTVTPSANCNAVGDSFNLGLACSQVSCPLVSTGACCHPDSSCDLTTMGDCILPDVYHDGVPCSPDPCAASGACCHADGGCDEVTADNCVAVGDVFHPGQTCVVGLCPGPEGSCSPGVGQEVFSSPIVGNLQMGRSVAIAGNTAVVGAPDHFGIGAAYVYVRAGAAWVQQALLTPSDGVGSESFGEYVDIDGDTIIVGSDGSGPEGAAYVYVRSAGIWTEQQKLVRAGSVNLGQSVAISGDRALVGTVMDEKVYYFKRSGVTWTFEQEILQPDPFADSRFGHKLDLDGDYAVIGAPFDDDNGGHSGSAYIFLYNGTTWTEQQKLFQQSPAAGQEFGASVAIDGDTVAVSSTVASSPARDVHAFRRSGVTWTLEQVMTVTDPVAGSFSFNPPDPFLGLSGNLIVVGTDGDDSPATNAGSAFVFKRSGATWTQLVKLGAFDAKSNDFFGTSTAVSGNRVVVGAWMDDSVPDNNSGSAYFFDLGCEAACCFPDASCQLITQDACDIAGGTYLGVGSTCAFGNCVPVPPALCCTGDINRDCERNANDVQDFINALLGVLPDAGTEDYCRLDANQSGTIDFADVTPFVDILLTETGLCPAVADCCKADMNNDGQRDGRDVQLFIESVLSPPALCSFAACSADTDGIVGVDEADAASFVDLLLTAGPCPQ
jgi:hypothetical protein